MKTVRVVHDLTVPDDFGDQTMLRVAADNALALKAAAQKTYIRGTDGHEGITVNHQGAREIRPQPAAAPETASSPPSSP